MINKPKFGSPCNGCGLCCIVQPCELSVEAFGSHDGPCVALEHENGRTYCGLLRHAPSTVQPLIAFALGIGAGCDSDD